MLGVAGRGGQQLASGGQGVVAAAEPGFELGRFGQVQRSRAAVDGCQLAERVGRVEQVARGFGDPRRGGQDRDRFLVESERLVDRDGGLGKLPRGFVQAGQAQPTRRCGFAGLGEPLLGCVDLGRQPFGRLEDFDLPAQDAFALLVVFGQLLGPIEFDERGVVLLVLGEQFGVLELAGEVVVFQFAGLAHRLHGFLQIAEA